MDENMQISGKWINKLTGEVIQIRNNIIDGDNMIILTDHGELSMNDFSNNYIQMGDEDIQNSNVGAVDNFKSMSALDGLMEEDKAILGNLNKPMQSIQPMQNNIYANETPTPVTTNLDDIHVDHSKAIKVELEKNNVSKKLLNESDDLKTALLVKLFDKLDFNIQLYIDVQCDKFPEKELKMLMDVYDITVDEITKIFYKFYSNNSSDRNITKDILNKIIENKINKKI